MLSNNVKQQQQVIEQLKSQLQKSNDQLAEKDAEIKQVRMLLDNPSQSTQQVSQTPQNELNEELENLRTKISTLELQIQNHQETIRELEVSKTEIQKLQEELQTSKSKFDQLKTTFSAQKGETEELKTNNYNLKLQADDLATKNGEKEKQILELKEENAKIAEQMQRQLKEKETENALIKQKLEDAQSKKQENLQSSVVHREQSEVDELNGKISDLQAKMEQQSQHSKEQHARLEELEQQKAKTEKQLKEETERRKVVELQIQQLNEKQKQACANNKEESKQPSSESQLKQLEHEILELKKQLAEKEIVSKLPRSSTSPQQLKTQADKKQPKPASPLLSTSHLNQEPQEKAKQPLQQTLAKKNVSHQILQTVAVLKAETTKMDFSRKSEDQREIDRALQELRDSLLELQKRQNGQRALSRARQTPTFLTSKQSSNLQEKPAEHKDLQLKTMDAKAKARLEADREGFSIKNAYAQLKKGNGFKLM